MLQFTEKLLSITMIDGLKQYVSPEQGIVHEIQVSKITDTRAANSESYPSYTQTASPYTHVKGRKAEQYKIEGPLCQVTEVDDFLENTSSRKLNTLYNVFLPCSILICSSNTDHGEIPRGSEWMVESFEISRSVAKRTTILYSLVLTRVYQEITNGSN